MKYSFETLSNREIFELVKQHLMAQGTLSIDERGCRYRDDYGLSCAIGALITDAEYSLHMERNTVSQLCSRETPLLSALQRIHDIVIPCDWETRLAKIEKEFLCS